MSYCVNPNCNHRQNSDQDQVCQACQTSLFLDGGRFRVIEKISNSETAHPWEVFKVEDIKDPGSGRYKVLKTLKYNTADYVRWFEGERKILLDSNFPGIPKLDTNFDIPETPEIDRPVIKCLVMEYIDGINLEEWLTNNKLAGSINDEIKAFQWLKEIVIILDYIHDKGYFHRDIKPANIMLSNYEYLTLIDYGHAVEIDNIPSQTRIYSSTYTAPEQREGRAVLQSDFYALGQTFVQLLTGKQPPSSIDEHRDSWGNLTSFPNSPLIPLINWLRKMDVNQRPHNTEQILRVIYLLQQKADWYRFNSNDTTNTIELVQTNREPENYLNIGSIIKENRSQVTQKKDAQIKLITEDITNEISYIMQEKDLKIRSIQMETGIKINQLEGEITGIRVQEQKNNNRRKLWMTLLGLISLLSIGANLIWLQEYDRLIANIQPPSDTDSSPTPILLSFGDRDIEKSYGSTNLSRDELSQKLKGVKLFEQRRYQEAYEEFYQLRSHKIPKKDPSILIYMNNAKVRYWHQKKPERSIYTIAAAIPAKIERGQHILFGVAHAQDRVVNPKFDGPYDHQVKDLNEEPEVYLEVGIADDGNSIQKSMEIAGKLTNLSIQDTRKKTRSILAVIGHYTSEATCAVLPIYDRAGLTLISPTSSMNELPQKCHSSNKVFFRTISSAQFEARRSIEILKNSNVKNLKITSFYKKDQHRSGGMGVSQDLFNLFKGQFKAEFDRELEDGFDLSDPREVNKGIETAKDTKANVIVVFPDGQVDNDRAFNQAINALEKVNTDRVNLVLSSSYLISNEINKLQPGLLKKWHKKLIVAADWHNDPQCSNTSFVERQHQLWGGDLNLTTAASYEAVQALSNLFKQEINQRSEIREQLAKVNIKSDVFNNKNISFDPNGDRTDITQRIVLTPDATGTKFEKADDKQCLR
jgi:eukaryotic-like serine/threonine-protein kinase